MDLPGSGCSCGGDRTHQAVRSGTSDFLGLEMVERLAKQDRLGVVLERPHLKPVAESAPFAGPAAAPPRPLDDRLCSRRDLSLTSST